MISDVRRRKMRDKAMVVVMIAFVLLSFFMIVVESVEIIVVDGVKKIENHYAK